MIAIPQRPVLTFAVGITGHRPNKLAGEAAARAERQLAEVFAAIEAACATRLEQDAHLYRKAPHRVRLLSSFAEGADQLAIRTRPWTWEVVAVLPFPRRRYERDFLMKGEGGEIESDHRDAFRAALAQANLIIELAEATDGAPGAYSRAGAFVLRQIDLLVAVWDGAQAAGTGGTAEMVARALDAGIPVVWIASTCQRAPWLIKSMSDLARAASLPDAMSGPLAEAVNGALAIDGAAAERLEAFLREPWRPICRWTAYDALTRFPRFWTWRARIRARDLPEIGKDWGGFIAELPGGDGFRKRVEELLLPRFAAADAQATHFAHAYRSAYVLGYLFAVISVAIALVGILPLGPSDPEGAVAFKAALVLLEFLFVTAIIGIVGVGHRSRWHERWLDYRALAEMLRHLRFLAPIGECGRVQLPSDQTRRGAEWLSWYLRATTRELGCPSAPVDAGYQRQILRATERFEVDEQIAYHLGNENHLRRLHRRLLHIGDVCFVATAAILSAFLLVFLAGRAIDLATRFAPWMLPAQFAGLGGAFTQALHSAGPLTIVLTAFLPALGATVAGIRFTGDFEGFADRSAQTAMALQRLKPDYALALEKLELGGTAHLLFDTARVMADDIGGWRSLYNRKRLTFPA